MFQLSPQQLARMADAPVADVAQAPVAAPVLSTPELIAAKAIIARASAENVPSPCISVCRMNEDTGWCEGCYRTIDEIRQWSKSDDAAKHALWRQIEQRLTVQPT